MNEISIHDRFIDFLLKLPNEGNRGALAALRRGLGLRPGEAPEMFPFVVPFLPDHPSYTMERAYYLVAALFAYHPDWTDEGDLGSHLAGCVQGEGDLPATERRFVALLNSHPDDLDQLLRQTISFLKSKEKPVNYRQLLRDILAWSNSERYVQRRWAASFWGRNQMTGSTTDGQS